MEEFIRKKVKNIKKISEKQIKNEVKFIGMRYKNDDYLLKKDLKSYINELSKINSEFKK